eukprot:14221517-Heterocapsa_arctica.AAC.1
MPSNDARSERIACDMVPRGGAVKCSPGKFTRLIRGGLVNLKAFTIACLEGHDIEVILGRPEVALLICE